MGAKLKKFLTNFTYPHLVWLGVVLSAVVTGWYAEFDSDMSGNLFAEVMGVAFTVGFVDFFSKKRDEIRRRPVQELAFKRGEQIYNRARWLWHMILVEAIHSKPDIVIEPPSDDLSLYQNKMADLVQHVSMELPSKANPNTKAKLFLGHWAKDLVKECQDYIVAYGVFADPSMLAFIDEIAGSSFLMIMGSHIDFNHPGFKAAPLPVSTCENYFLPYMRGFAGFLSQNQERLISRVPFGEIERDMLENLCKQAAGVASEESAEILS
jgi:hypothetical protein